jgi:hypothetical protein
MTRDVLWTPAETADFLRVTVGTLANWRVKGIGPRHVKRGPGRMAHVGYLESVVRAWVQAHQRSSTSDKPAA